jgi:glyoxylase-like metal-dependent hydrolase (beta-lactamase superfamily II)
MRSSLFVPAVILAAAPAAAPADDRFDRLADPPAAPWAVEGDGFVTDDSHPWRPGDFQRYDVSFRISVDPDLGEAAIALSAVASGATEPDLYWVRRGRIFQVNDAGEEIATGPFGDLSPATIAALHPALVADAMRERRENVLWEDDARCRFAWNDELWRVSLDAGTGAITGLERDTRHDVHGDGVERIRYEESRVSVVSGGREIAGLSLRAPAGAEAPALPDGNRRRDRARLVARGEIAWVEIAPGLFAADLPTISSRVFVAEFADHLFVIEGAYNSRICDRIAESVRERFGKPVRYFAFSHLHGQYLGGTRSWVAEGATVLCPPTTAPLIEQVAAAPHALRPDALAASPKPLSLETIPDRRRFEDATNAVEVLNVESEHTDEYFVFYFPAQKILLTGDLLFYKPGKPLTGRSKKLCETVARLGLDVERYWCTWPLSGYDTKNVVTAAEMQAGCADAP